MRPYSITRGRFVLGSCKVRVGSVLGPREFALGPWRFVLRLWGFFWYQHVGQGNAKISHWGSILKQSPNANGFAFWWNIGLNVLERSCKRWCIRHIYWTLMALFLNFRGLKGLKSCNLVSGRGSFGHVREVRWSHWQLGQCFSKTHWTDIDITGSNYLWSWGKLVIAL